MRRFALAFFLVAFLAIQLSAQVGTTAPPAPQDPQAVAVLNQALAAAGGGQAIVAIQDYTATGNISYPLNQTDSLQGTVTVLGRGPSQFRLDASLPKGTRSLVVSQGTTASKAEDGRISRLPPDHPLPASDAFPYKIPTFPGALLCPELQLAISLQSPQIAISYKGDVVLDNNSTHDVQIYFVRPPYAPPPPGILATGGTENSNNSAAPGPYETVDFFIDAATAQIVMIQDMIPKNVVHQVRYSDYRPVGGVLIPFSIVQRLDNQDTSRLALQAVTFNTGLSDSAFVIN